MTASPSSGVAGVEEREEEVGDREEGGLALRVGHAERLEVVGEPLGDGGRGLQQHIDRLHLSRGSVI